MGKVISCIFFEYGTKIHISSEIYPPLSVTVLFLVKSGSMIIDKSENRWPNSFCEIPCFSSNYKVNQDVLAVSYVSFIPFGFLSLLTKKLWKHYVIFVYILQGKRGKTEKTKKITQLKWPKCQKPKDKNKGWTKQ